MQRSRRRVSGLLVGVVLISGIASIATLRIFRSAPSNVAAAPVRPSGGERAGVSALPGGVRLELRGAVYGTARRSRLLAVPTREVPGRRLPLLIDLHGRGSTPRFAAQQSELLPWVAAGEVLAVFPAGYQKSWNADGCCGSAAHHRVNDLGFLRGLARSLSTRADVDANRIAVLGFSNGGRMAIDVACSRDLDVAGMRLRAIVAVEAISIGRCVGGPRVSTLVTAGTRDPFVGYAEPTRNPNGGRLPSVQAEVAGWSHAEGCAKPRTVTTSFPQELLSCSAGQLTLLTLPGGRHRWPPAIDPLVQRFLRDALGIPVA